MNSSQQLALQLANQLGCQNSRYAIGPTGAQGPTGTSGVAGNPKVFTIYIDYTPNFSNSINRVYIPPGLSTTVHEGIYTADVAGLTFIGTSTITILNTTYAFPIGLSATGYAIGGYWTPTAGGNLGGTAINWQQTIDTELKLSNLTATYLNGGNTITRPSIGILNGWLATLTIQYL